MQHTDGVSQRELVGVISGLALELTDLVTGENVALTKRDVATVAANIKHKTKLALKLEKALQDVKSQDAVYDDSIAADLKFVQSQMATLHSVGQKNARLLQAAHQVRADTIQAIRDMVHADLPKVQTYGANGQIAQNTNAMSLINKAV